MLRPAIFDQIPPPAGVGPVVEDPTIDLVLGFPPKLAYTDVWFLTGDPVAVEQAYVATLQGLGFRVLPSDTTAIEGATVIPSLSPDGTQVVAVVIIPPATLATNEDFSEAAELAPDGQGFVLLVAFPPE